MTVDINAEATIVSGTLNASGELSQTLTADADVGLVRDVFVGDPDDYYTKDDIDSKGYLTEVPSEYVTDTELNSKGYLTSIPSEYVTDSELDEKGYLTSVPSEYVTDAELNAKGYLTEHQSLTGYAKESWVESKGYLTQHQDISGKANASDVYTKTQTDGLLSAKADSSDVYTKEETQTLAQGLMDTIGNIQSEVELKAYTSDVYSKDQIDGMGFLTEHQDISGKSDVGHTHKTDEVLPITTKTFTDVLATSSNIAALRPFFRVIPTDWDSIAKIEYRFKSYVEGHESAYSQNVECYFSFFHNTTPAYCCRNFIASTSYRPIYYNSMMRCKEDYANIGHLVGINFYNAGNSYSRNATTAGYERTFEVEILSTDNCTVEWMDTCEPVSAQTVEGYIAGTTHDDIANYNGTTQGETHSGDANTNYYDRMVFPSAILNAGAPSGKYSIGFVTSDGEFCGIAQTSATGTSKTLNTNVEIDPNLCFYQLTSTYATGAGVAASALYSRHQAVDIRYSCNQGSWMTAKKPVYIKLSMASSGYFTINAPTFTHTLPTSNDGFYYKLIGYSYSATNIIFEPRETLYFHDGTKLCRY